MSNNNNSKKREIGFVWVSLDPSEYRPKKRSKTASNLNRLLVRHLLNKEDINSTDLKGATKIKIKEISMDHQRTKILCNFLQLINSIEEVEFDNTTLGLNSITQLVAGLGRQHHLTRLDIKRCDLDDTCAKLILEFAQTSKSLTLLNLSNNRIYLEGEWVVEPLASCKLIGLDLSYNVISENGSHNLAQALQRNKSIKRLYLQNNSIYGVVIAHGLLENGTLEYLDLGGHKTNQVCALAPVLKVNQSLKVLNLNGVESINDVDFLDLVSALKKNNSLIHVSLHGAKLPKEYIQTFHKYFQELQQQKELSSYEKQLIEYCTPANDGPEIDLPYEQYSPNTSFDFLNGRVDRLPGVEGDDKINTQLCNNKRQMYNKMKEAFDNFEKRHKEIDKENQILLENRQQKEAQIHMLRNQIVELENKINALEDQLPKHKTLVFAEINALRIHAKYPAVKTYVEKFHKELEQKEQSINRQREKIKSKPVANWTVADVVEFMKDIQAPDEAVHGIDQNEISGQILLGLTTQDITQCLKMSYNEAKRLQTYILLVKCKKDIFSEFTGVLAWKTKHVVKWLKEKGLNSLTTTFKHKGITGQELLMIDGHDLGSFAFKVKTIAVKVAFEEAIKELRREYDPFNEFGQQHEVKPAKKKIELKQEIKKKAPSALICPLTKQLMVDPVQLSDGHTYERSAIEAWLADNDTSPVTHQVLTSTQIIPSFTIKAMIDEFNNQ